MRAVRSHQTKCLSDSPSVQSRLQCPEGSLCPRGLTRTGLDPDERRPHRADPRELRGGVREPDGVHRLLVPGCWSRERGARSHPQSPGKCAVGQIVHLRKAARSPWSQVLRPKRERKATAAEQNAQTGGQDTRQQTRWPLPERARDSATLSFRKFSGVHGVEAKAASVVRAVRSHHTKCPEVFT